ncbi:mitochondrial small ribosomal subunit protein uS17m [Candidatus Daviesbacteria bacterium]|nr:mitochondrial small ribosomal subunit protein uS17m [Candidatus Daviesbacteria bacterium]
MIGRVTSTKLQNTATVIVERVAAHPLYKKTFIRTKKYLADDSIGVKDGDIVEIIKCKPVSKNKHFKITKVVGKNLAEIVEAEQKMAAEEVIAEAVPAGRQVMPEDKASEPVKDEARQRRQGTVDSKQSEKIKEKPVKKIKSSSKIEKGGKE